MRASYGEHDGGASAAPPSRRDKVSYADYAPPRGDDVLNRERRVSDEPEYAGPSTSRAALLPPPPSSYDFPPAEATQQQQAIVYAPSPPPQSQLRLVKLSSEILPSSAQVAVVETDGQGTSIGRDKAYTPRIRLPVMEVSKHHCNIFSMSDPASAGQASGFFVSDSGSTYGTHILPAREATTALQAASPDSLRTSAFKRLSEPKQASAPHPLQHGDLLRVAKTTFAVHIHSSPYFSCKECSLNEAGSNEIRLVSASTSKPESGTNQSSSQKTAKQTAAEEERYLTGGLRGSGDRRIDARTARKRQLQELQSYYLDDDQVARAGQTGGSASVGSANRPYHDRAAQRRARDPAATTKRSRVG